MRKTLAVIAGVALAGIGLVGCAADEPVKRIAEETAGESEQDRKPGQAEATEELEYLTLRTPTGRFVECVTYAGELDCDWSIPRFKPMLHLQPLPLER